MIIEQFFDSNLAHYSYAILNDGAVAVIDPSRDPEPYYNFVRKHNAELRYIIETHPHADFVSSHLEMSKHTGLPVYISEHYDAEYDHVDVKDGDEFELGSGKLQMMFTPGHSPDSISVLAINDEAHIDAVFTGDSLFIGDCGRPDLREEKGNMQTQREELAKQMYHTLQDKFLNLADEVMVYPAHGAGSLCGKGLSDKNVSTMGEERANNWSLKVTSEDEFVKALLEDQPFIPKYFSYDVKLNKQGAPDFAASVSTVDKSNQFSEDGTLIIDTRAEGKFKAGHAPGAINLMEGEKFETWLGSIVAPGEEFNLVAENEGTLNSLIERTAKIGYEHQIKKAIADNIHGTQTTPILDIEHFKSNPDAYTIVDIRNESEVKNGKIFDSAISVPLHELREKKNEIPRDKPIVVHCAGGYRSAAGASILENGEQVAVYDLSDNIKDFK